MSDAIEIAMFESGWFGRGEPFWRWVKTPEAKPYIEAFVAQRQPLKRGEPLNLIGGFDEEDEPDLLDPDHLRKLARDIEARFSEGAQRDATK